MAKTILCVCTGNSCRSVMAEWLLRQRLCSASGEGPPPDYTAASAGLAALDGMSASDETVRVLREQAGVDASAHRARRLADSMVRDAALILVMERWHVEEILRRVPDASAKVRLLSAFGQSHAQGVVGEDIIDPIGKPRDVYEVCFTTIKTLVDGVVRSLT